MLNKTLAIVILAFMTAAASAEIVITEIMYNPDSSEGKPSMGNEKTEANKVEWVELYNTGNEEIDLGGYTLGDEDGTTGPVDDGSTIKPQQAVILFPAECGNSAFAEAWGEDIMTYPVTDWTDGIKNLANGPHEKNEILVLRDSAGITVDQVNYDDEGDWPSDSPDGASIYLIFTALDTESNDDGSNWKRSIAGQDGARNNNETEVFNGEDTGSPGTVPSE